MSFVSNTLWLFIRMSKTANFIKAYSSSKIRHKKLDSSNNLNLLLHKHTAWDLIQALLSTKNGIILWIRDKKFSIHLINQQIVWNQLTTHACRITSNTNNPPLLHWPPQNLDEFLLSTHQLVVQHDIIDLVFMIT